MITFLAWALIGSTVFLGVFYLNIYRNSAAAGADSVKSGKPPVSVMMPAYNEEDVVEESLEAVLDLDYPRYNVFFVDDGSTDSTVEKAREFQNDPKLEIIEHGENRGKAAALNTALEKADSRYAVVLDADSRIEPGLLEKTVARFEGNRDLGAVIASIRPLSRDTFWRKLQSVQYRVTNFYRSLMSEIGTIDVTPGAFSMYRLSDLKELGGFDVGNPTEDLEIAWRLRRIGREVDMVYVDYSSTQYPATFRALYNQRVRWARGSLVNSFKHRDMFFDSDYGWFGRVQLPIHILSPVIAIASLLLIATGVVQRLFNFFIQVSAVGLNLPALQSFNLVRFFLNLPVKIYLPLAAGLVVSAYIIRSAYRKAGDSVSHPLALSVYYLAFFALYAFFWIAAVLKEIFRTKRVWI